MYDQQLLVTLATGIWTLRMFLDIEHLLFDYVCVVMKGNLSKLQATQKGSARVAHDENVS